MANNEIKVKISAEDQLSPSMEKALNAVKGLNSGLLNFSAGLHVVQAAAELVHKGFEVLEGSLHKAIEEALQGEKANNLLTGALVQTGNYTEDLNKALNDYVDTLEVVVGVNGEAAKGMIATGLQMGLNVQKAKELEQAARQLAAANGIDNAEAFSALQSAMLGQTRALARYIPQVKELTAAQLKQGQAIDIVNKSTKAQYEIYQSSLPAAIDKSKVAVDNIYKSLGQAFTENAALKSAINTFVSQIQSAAEWMEHNKSTVDSFITESLIVLIDTLEAANVTLDALARTGTVAFEGIKIAINSVKLGIETILTGPLALLFSTLSNLPGAMGEAFGKSSQDLMNNMAASADSIGQSVDNASKAMFNQTSASKTVEDSLLGVRDAILEADKAEKTHNETRQQSLSLTSEQNKQALLIQQTYDGFEIGTAKQREQLLAQTQDRDNDLKNFKTYLDSKTRLAVDQATEEEMEVNKVKAAALKGSGGTSDFSAQAQVEVDTEIKKQQALQVYRQQGLINEQEYQQARLASLNNQQMAELSAAQAHEKALSNALGESEEAFQLKLQLEEERFQAELAQKTIHAEQEGATEQQILAMREAANQQHLANVKQQKLNHIAADQQQNELLNDQWAVSLGKIRAEQEKHGKIMGTIKGIQQTTEYQGTQQALSDLSSLRNSNSRQAFEIGQKAAIAQATINTFMSATAAFAAMAAIPIVGPALGAAAAAAAVAAGIVNIQKISSQKFNPGGQADEGMDSVPQSLSGKSFVLSAGERVVQPEANKDLKDFLNKEKTGNGTSKGMTNNITLHYNGPGGQDDARKMAEIIMQEIRRASERGSPIMSKKGLTD